jgi:catechol 2,3-dioxygenase-like lactoylglutathione lyase family enzyme
MIGKLRSVVLDCPEPRRLADFYAAVLGGEVAVEDHGSQQFHLDIEVDDVDVAESKVLANGATRVPDAVGEDGFRVYRDPAGHPFCLVWGEAG